MHTLHEDQCTFFILSCIVLRMRYVSGEGFGKNQNTFYVALSLFKNRTIYGMVWQNIVEPGRPYMAIWRIRIACWSPKSTNTHPEDVVRIGFRL